MPPVLRDLRELPGTAGRYAAGADGRIYSRREIGGRRPCDPRRQIVRALKVDLDSREYETVRLYDGMNRRRCCRVHRLVAIAWYGPAPYGAAVVRHLDGNKRNNRPENLAWGNQSENMFDWYAWREQQRRLADLRDAGIDVDGVPIEGISDADEIGVPLDIAVAGVPF